MFFSSKNNKIVVNGVHYGSGDNITINGNKVIVDGKDVTPDSKTINISVEGNLGKLRVDHCDSININGEAGSVQTTNGDVDCHDIKGSVSTTNGDVDCSSIGGSVSTVNGDIKNRGRRD